MLLTGAYNSNLHVIDIKNQTNCQFDVQFLDKRGKNVGKYKAYKGKKLVNPTTNDQAASTPDK